MLKVDWEKLGFDNLRTFNYLTEVAYRIKTEVHSKTESEAVRVRCTTR